MHSKATKQPLLVRETRKEPLKVEEWVCELDKKKFGPRFKKDGKAVEEAINDLSQEMREKLSLEMKEKGKVEISCPDSSLPNGKAEINKELLTIEKRTRVENVREYIPNVIEPVCIELLCTLLSPLTPFLFGISPRLEACVNSVL